MPKINLLSKDVAELIAAGEVVERPASVIKELVENSIDSGATIITVKINRGGISLISVTDNGCGIDYDDVPLAFLRHATSKIKTGEDLNSIATLGFRGEALAAVSSVARVEMLTKTASASSGTFYSIEGGVEVRHEEAGCPNGTTITIKDLFFNTPARMKFLKTDMGEGNACAAVIDRIALSHPEISFKFIRDGKQVLSTSGNGDIRSTIYSVLGKDFANSLIEVENSLNGVSVSGLVCKPVFCKSTRNNQFTFLNGRFVRSGTVSAACEQAYKNSAMVGKFPGFVLYLTVPLDSVDVNVHPAKTEVRFSDEKRVFEAVYVAVKNAISNLDTRPEIKLNTPTFNQFERMSTEEFKQQIIPNNVVTQKFETKDKDISVSKPVSQNSVLTFKQNLTSQIEKIFYGEEKVSPVRSQPTQKVNEIIEEVEEVKNIKLIGEAFSTYIIVQVDESIYLIDKHAAHERILFEKYKKEQKIAIQALLTPVTVFLPKEEYNALITNTDILEEGGFEIDDFGNSSVLVRAVPVIFVNDNINNLVAEIADSLIKSGTLQTERKDNLFHTVACKAAIKAGNHTTQLEMQNLAETVLNSKEIMYCPHGRPVAFEIKRKELERKFGRIQ